jgi:photosystem II stability/assembly factor-like uncharacterized protein
MRNNFQIERFVMGALLIIIFPLQLVWGQANWTLTTNKSFNRITLKNGSNIITSVPVMSPADKIMNNVSVSDVSVKNSLLEDWTPLQTVSGVVKAVSFVNPDVGYMAAELGVVYKTTDGGLNWTTVLNLGFPYYWYGVHTFTPQKVLIAGFNNSTGDGIIRWSNDGGTTWTDDIIIAPAPLNWLQGLGFADSLHGLAVGSILSAGKVFITSNGGINVNDWASVVADSTQGWFAGNFTMRPDGKYYITGISFCNSADFGLTWARRSSIDNVFDGGVSFPDDLHGWTGGGSISPTVEGWVHRTTDGGNTWSSRILSTPYPIRVVYFFDSQMGIAQGGNVNSGVGGIWESDDGGVNWTEAVNTGLEMGSLDWQRVSPDSIDIWSVGYTSSGGFHSVVYKKRIGYAIIPVELVSFTAKIQNGSVLLNWQTETETNNRGFEIERLQDYKITRLQNSPTGKTGWETIGFLEGNGTTTLTHSYSYTDKNVIPGKYYYRLKQIDFNGSYDYNKEIEVDVTAPTEFSLEQNYPNPFNPATKIKFKLADDSKVSLKVFDVLGREIATLLNSDLSGGEHTVNFSAKGGMQSGVYFYRLEANGNNGKNFISIKKMILLK